MSTEKNGFQPGIHNLSIPCRKHPTKRIEYVCVRPGCEQERVYCTACVFKKVHCRHDDYIRDLDEVLEEQRKQMEMKGLLGASYIFEFFNQKQIHLVDYQDRVRAQENIINDEIDGMIKQITAALENVKKAMHNQLRVYLENYRTSFENLEHKISDNFSKLYVSHYNKFSEVLSKFAPFTTESLLEMLQNLLADDYSEQFKVSDEVESAYNAVMLMKEEAPQFDQKRFNNIKGYFNVFKDKMTQNLASLVNTGTGDEEMMGLNVSFNQVNRSRNLTRDLSGRTISNSPMKTLSHRKFNDNMSTVSASARFTNHSFSKLNLHDISMVQKEDFSAISGRATDRPMHKSVLMNKNMSEQAFGKNHQVVEIRRIQLSTSFESYHSRTILCLLHLKDTLIASSSDDGTIKFWDVISFRCVKVLKGHTAGVRSIVLLGNGDLVSGSWDRTIKIWKTSELIDKYNGDSQVIRINEHSKTLKGHLNAVLCVHVMVDGCTIVSGSTDYQVKMWDAESGQCLKTFHGHQGEILSLVSRQDNKTILSGCGDRTIKVWNTEKKLNTCIDTLSGHAGPVWCIKLLSDDDTLVTSSPDKMIKLWSIQKGQCTKTILGHQNHVLNLCEYKENTLLSCDNEGVIKIWDLATTACLNTIQNKTGSIHALAITNDFMIVGGGTDKRVYIWN